MAPHQPSRAAAAFVVANPGCPDLPFGRPAEPPLPASPADAALPIYPVARPLVGAEVTVPATDHGTGFSFRFIGRWITVTSLHGDDVIVPLPSVAVMDRILIRGYTGWNMAEYRQHAWLGLPGRILLPDSLSRAAVTGTRVSTRRPPRHVRVWTTEFVRSWATWLRPQDDR